MPKITYIEHNGKTHIQEVPNGLSVMEGAVQNNIPGIDADCGGSCACATCHIYIDHKWFDILPNIEDDEEAMLDQTFHILKISRLGCQIEYEDKYEGINLTLAPE